MNTSKLISSEPSSVSSSPDQSVAAAAHADLTVELLNFDDLSQEEQESGLSNNGCGKEYANYIRVRHNGETLFLESDACEPEDKTFRRDLRWIKDALLRCHELGQDVATHADIKPALLFAGDIINSFAESWGSDFDGLDIQNTLERWGLLNKQVVTPENICEQGCDCEMGDYCYRLNRYATVARLAYLKAIDEKTKGE